MAQSRVSIINFGLNLLGQERVGSVDEPGPATDCNAVFDLLRDYEQRANAWVFTRKRAILAPHGVAPAFGYLYAFPLPVDCLRPLKPVDASLDWSIESHEGLTAILTNRDAVIQLRYLARITNETKFDPMFAVMLGCRIGFYLCEKLSQSNTKREMCEHTYQQARMEARKMNAFEKVPQQGPVDPWLLAMSDGQLADNQWNQE